MTNFYESAIGSKRLLRTYEQMRTECFDDLLYCCAVTVEDAMLMGGSVPGVDYNRIDLFKLAMPLALENMKGSANSGGSKGSLITTGVPESHPMAGLEIALDAIEAEILEYIQKKPDNTLNGISLALQFRQSYSDHERPRSYRDALARLIKNGRVIKYKDYPDRKREPYRYKVRGAA